jgi:hypothetical protein
LGADVTIDAGNAQVGAGGGALIDPVGGMDVDAKLVFPQAGGDIGVGARIHVRVDADRHRGDGAQGPGDPFQTFQFGLGLDIEAADADFQGPAHLLRALADAGEDDLGRVAPRRQHPLQFAAGDDVETGAHAGQDIEYRQVGVGLDGKADQVGMMAEGGVECPPVALQGGAGIDIARGAEALGDMGNRHLLGMKAMFLVLKMIHRRGFLADGWRHGFRAGDLGGLVLLGRLRRGFLGDFLLVSLFVRQEEGTFLAAGGHHLADAQQGRPSG